MTKFGLLSAVVLFVTLPHAAVSQEQPADVVKAFHEAIARFDTSAVLDYLDPNVIIFESGRAEMSRDEFSSHHMGADMAFAAATTREAVASQTNIVGDIAYVMNQSRTTGTFREREIDSSGMETVVLEQKPDGWKIIHIHWSSRRQ